MIDPLHLTRWQKIKWILVRIWEFIPGPAKVILVIFLILLALPPLLWLYGNYLCMFFTVNGE